MPYYLSRYIGTGNRGDAFRPLGSDQPGWAAIDLRADGGATLDGNGLNACLLYLPDPSATKGLDLLADHHTERISAASVSALCRALGLSRVDATAFDQSVLEIVTGPPANAWHPARDRVHLGPLLAERPGRTGGGEISGFLLCALGCHVWLAGIARWWPIIAGGGAQATDDFNRANNADLGANWTPNLTTFEVVSNQAVPHSPGGSAERYSGLTWANDQYSQAKLTGTLSTTDDEGCGPAVRASTASANTMYLAQADNNGSGHARVYKVVAGAYTALLTPTQAWVANDVYYLEIQGTTILQKRNGTQISTSTTDSAIASGAAGIWGVGDGSGSRGTLDDWEGGDFAAGGPTVAQTMAAMAQARTCPALAAVWI